MLSLTDKALVKAIELRDANGSDSLVLRVSVQPGGCSGMRYNLVFDTSTTPDDVLAHLAHGQSTLVVAVDKPSEPYLTRATIDFVESLEKIGFVIDNPDANGGCACGDSFN
jgi:iron-sulfur cluster assembly accessory protein